MLEHGHLNNKLISTRSSPIVEPCNRFDYAQFALHVKNFRKTVLLFQSARKMLGGQYLM